MGGAKHELGTVKFLSHGRSIMPMDKQSSTAHQPTFGVSLCAHMNGLLLGQSFAPPWSQLQQSDPFKNLLHDCPLAHLMR